MQSFIDEIAHAAGQPPATTLFQGMKILKFFYADESSKTSSNVARFEVTLEQQ